MKTNPIKGVLPVIHLPFHEDYSIDYAVLEKEIHWLFDNGVDGIVIAMVSEVFRLTDLERDQLVENVVKFTNNRGPVISSVGAESTIQAVRHAQQSQELGAAALMAIPPSMTISDEDGLTNYFESILEATNIPLIIQDASGYAGNSIPIHVQSTIYKKNPERVMFKPEGKPIGPYISSLRDSTNKDALIFEGTGGIGLYDSYKRGIAGTMPGSDLSKAIVEIWRALEAGNYKRARQIHLPLSTLIAIAHNLDAFLIIEKILLMEQGIFTNSLVRGPVGFKLDVETKREVLNLFHLIKRAIDKPQNAELL